MKPCLFTGGFMKDKESIRVLILITRLNNGGAAKHALYLAKGLLEDMGFDSCLACGETEENEDHILSYAERKGLAPVIIKNLKRSLNPLRDCLALVDVYKLLREKQPHIIHTHMSKAGFIGRLAALIYNLVNKEKVKITHTFHGHIFHSYFPPFITALFVYLEKFLAGKSNALIAVSPLVKTQVQKRLDLLGSSKFEVIPLGMEFPYLHGIEQSPIVNTPFLQVGMLGRLAPIKNYGLAVEIAQLCKEKGLPVKIKVGGSGSDQDMRELTTMSSSSIIFLGNVENPAEFWSTCHIALVTSKNEGTPVSLMEAMSHGLPFVASRVGGIPDMAGEFLEKKGNLQRFFHCILVDGFEAHDYADALAFFLDYSVREKAGKEAARFAREHYSLKKMLERYKILYQSILTD